MSLLSTLKFITSQPLNRRRKFDSLLHFAKWQIGSRLAPGAVAHERINGARFLVRLGETGLTGNIYAALRAFIHDMAMFNELGQRHQQAHRAHELLSVT